MRKNIGLSGNSIFGSIKIGCRKTVNCNVN